MSYHFDMISHRFASSIWAQISNCSNILWLLESTSPNELELPFVTLKSYFIIPNSFSTRPDPFLNSFYIRRMYLRLEPAESIEWKDRLLSILEDAKRAPANSKVSLVFINPTNLYQCLGACYNFISVWERATRHRASFFYNHFVFHFRNCIICSSSDQTLN